MNLLRRKKRRKRKEEKEEEKEEEEKEEEEYATEDMHTRGVDSPPMANGKKVYLSTQLGSETLNIHAICQLFTGIRWLVLRVCVSP